MGFKYETLLLHYSIKPHLEALPQLSPRTNDMGRVYRSEAQWRALIDELEHSDLSRYVPTIILAGCVVGVTFTYNKVELRLISA